MTYITADSETLMKQAPWTAAEYLRGAVEKIDFEFGKGFAKAHPELVGQFILACALDFHAGVVARAIETASNDLGTNIEGATDQLTNIANEIETIRENMPTGEPE